MRGAHLVTRDYIEVDIEAERLDGGGISRVAVPVANILAYTVLKILAYQDRHENKDSYDLVFCLLNYGDEPEHAGRVAHQSPIRDAEQVREALQLLAERYQSADHDGAVAYAAFLHDGNAESTAQHRQEAVAVVGQFLDAV